MTRRWLFLTASTRPEGNALQLARTAAAAIPAGHTRLWFDLARPAVPPFADRRGYHRAPRGRLRELAEATLAADEIVMVSPIYWYSLAGPGHAALDHWSGWLDVERLQFEERMKGKRLWLVTARADADPATTKPVETAMRLTARWMGMRFGGALHGIGDAPGDVLSDAAAMSRARDFFAAPEE